MMKGAASIADIAVAAGVPDEEVRDFVNANLATGYAEAAAMSSRYRPVSSQDRRRRTLAST